VARTAPREHAKKDGADTAGTVARWLPGSDAPQVVQRSMSVMAMLQELWDFDEGEQPFLCEWFLQDGPTRNESDILLSILLVDGLHQWPMAACPHLVIGMCGRCEWCFEVVVEERVHYPPSRGQR
jgi:hypothetical protein